MSANHDAIVQQIQCQFDRLLDAVRGQKFSNCTSYEMEKFLFTSLLEFGCSLMQLFLISQSDRYRSREVISSDGETIPYHSERERTYQSVFGKIAFRRSYYYRKGNSQCPADAALNLPATQCSDLLREWLEKLGVCDPYSKSCEVLGDILGQSLWARDLKAEIAEDAELVKEFYEQAESPCVNEEATILVVQADGKGVPMLREEPVEGKARRGKGEKPGRKKEAIVTAVYTNSPQVRTPESVVASLFKKQQDDKASETKRSRPHQKQYWATLDGKQEAMEFTRQQVNKHDGPHIKHRIALTDGSEALQNQVQGNMQGYQLMLDFIHADEYLWKAGNALFGETSPKRQPWVGENTLQMLSGRTDEVIVGLRQEATRQPDNIQKVLEQVANYYERNIERMRYDEYLAAGLPIATGVIEGACRHVVKDRCELSGMRWSQEGAEALLRMRCVEENGDWDSFHEYRRNHRQRTLYAGVVPRPEDTLPACVFNSQHILLAT